MNIIYLAEYVIWLIYLCVICHFSSYICVFVGARGMGIGVLRGAALGLKT